MELLGDNRVVPLKGQIIEQHLQRNWIFIKQNLFKDFLLKKFQYNE